MTSQTAKQTADLKNHHHAIEVCAYFKARNRGFSPGYELEDWLSAEQEILAAMTAESKSTPVEHEERPAVAKKQRARRQKTK